MANRIFDLPETKGTFQIKGLINGVEKESFYTSKKTKTNKDFKAVNFGCAYDTQKTVYLSLNGMPQPNVYFSKKNTETGKTDVKPIPWANRNKFSDDGWRLIGVNLGLEKITDDNGKLVNDKKTFTSFDACDYIKAHMHDNASMFIKGNLEFSSFTDDKGNIRRSTKYIPSQISLCKDVDFSDYNDENKPVHDFTQHIIFMGIDKEVIDDKDTGRFVVSAKIVTYSEIVDKEFFITDAKLAKVFKNNLKPYHAITVHGKIEVSHNIQTVSEEDCWGETNTMNSTTASSQVELMITGATPSTIDKETYNEKNVSEAMKKIIAAKTADNKFVVETTNDDDDDLDWGDTDSNADDDDTPW